jgi:hypothetical protein
MLLTKPNDVTSKVLLRPHKAAHACTVHSRLLVLTSTPGVALAQCATVQALARGPKLQGNC